MLSQLIARLIALRDEYGDLPVANNIYDTGQSWMETLEQVFVEESSPHTELANDPVYSIRRVVILDGG